MGDVEYIGGWIFNKVDDLHERIKELLELFIWINQTRNVTYFVRNVVIVSYSNFVYLIIIAFCAICIFSYFPIKNFTCLCIIYFIIQFSLIVKYNLCNHSTKKVNC